MVAGTPQTRTRHRCTARPDDACQISKQPGPIRTQDPKLCSIMGPVHTGLHPLDHAISRIELCHEPGVARHVGHVEGQEVAGPETIEDRFGPVFLEEFWSSSSTKRVAR